MLNVKHDMSININDIPKTIETLMSQTLVSISQAASKPDYDVAELERLTKQASELKEMKAEVAAIQQRLLSMNGGGGGSEVRPQAAARGRFLREILIEVSQGMINQNLLTMTEALKHRQLKVGEELDVVARPSGERFKSTVIQPGNKLQARGAVGNFYREAKVRDGDDVILRETEPGRWELLKLEPSVPR